MLWNHRQILPLARRVPGVQLAISDKFAAPAGDPRAVYLLSSNSVTASEFLETTLLCLVKSLTQSLSFGSPVSYVW